MTEIKPKKKFFSNLNWILGGLGFGLVYWSFESIRDVVVFDRGTIVQRLFMPDIRSFWMRLLVICLIILFGMYSNALRERMIKGKKGKLYFLHKIGMIGASVGFGILYWIIESVRDVFLNQNNSFFERLLMPGSMEFWIRILAVFVLLLYGVYAQSLINTYRKEEEILRNSKERQKLIFEYAPDAYYIIDLKGKITDANQAAEELIGTNKEELIGKNLLKTYLLPENQTQKTVDFLEKNTLGESAGPDEFILNRSDGSKIPVEIRAHPVQIKNETVLLGIARDITERKLAEEKIKAALKEKEILLKEIHHRVKNNLQVISSLLNLQTKYIKDSYDLKLFNESKNRIRSMALIHEKLYQSPDLERVNFSNYIENLVNDLFSSFSTHCTNITPIIEVEDVGLTIDKAIPCGLIINELVSNSITHAFPASYPEAPKIEVAFHEVGDGKVELKIADNGIGLPKGFDIVKTESLGLKIVQVLAEGQLNGDIEYGNSNGTTFQVRFMN